VRLDVRAIVVALACAIATGCGGGSETPGPVPSNTGTGGEPGQTVDLEPQAGRSGPEYVGTGEGFDGPFALGDASLSMAADGEFVRTRQNGVADGGTYLVTADGRLVLFVERIGESRLGTARPEVFSRSDLVPAP
jgi:hypothetical protein